MKKIKVVAAIIEKDGKYLITQRAEGQFKDLWEFPGGKVEAGESEQEALHREIKEELDMPIEILSFFHSVEYEYPEFFLSMDCYLCRPLKEQLTLKVHKGFKWVKSQEFNSVSWLPADLDMILQFEEIITKNHNKTE